MTPKLFQRSQGGRTYVVELPTSIDIDRPVCLIRQFRVPEMPDDQLVDDRFHGYRASVPDCGNVS